MPWLPEAHERATTEPVPHRRPRLRDRARRRLHRLLHPHADLLAGLERMSWIENPEPDMVKLHPHAGHIIAVACPACGMWRTDPTTGCPRCGL